MWDVVLRADSTRDIPDIRVSSDANDRPEVIRSAYKTPSGRVESWGGQPPIRSKSIISIVLSNILREIFDI